MFRFASFVRDSPLSCETRIEIPETHESSHSTVDATISRGSFNIGSA